MEISTKRTTNRIPKNGSVFKRFIRSMLVSLKARWTLLAISGMVVTLFPAITLAAGSDFTNTDFAAAAPFTYNHETGGGAYNDRTVGEYADVTEQHEGGQFTSGDIVSYLVQIELEATTVDPVQTAQFDFSFLANSTGQAGAAHSEVVGVRINYGQVENGDSGTGVNPGAGLFGLDSGISDDAGSTATLISQSLTGPLFQSGSELHATVEVNDLEPGEKVVLRIDTRLACDPGSSSTGNLQGHLDAGRVVYPNGTTETINTGQQTIPFLRVGDIAGAGEPLLAIEKTVTTSDGTCGVDDVESLSVSAGDTVKYCYTVSNPGTANLLDVEVVDDNGTPGNTADDFTVILSGLTDLDGDADPRDLVGGAAATGEALITMSSESRIVNTAEATGNNGSSDGNFQELTASDTATVNVEPWPNNPPVANEDSATTPEDTPVTINATANDTDMDGNLDPTTTTLTNGPSNGTVVNNGDGTFTYTPNKDYNGPDSFEYQVCDSQGACDTATVTITVTPVNAPPMANDDATTINQDTPVTINGTSNDTDVDGNLDPTTATLTNGPSNGTVINKGDGTFTYTPNSGFFGTDSFEYEVCDSEGACDTATVTITVLEVVPVNNPPVAGDDYAATDEDMPATIDVTADNGYGADSDPDGNLNPSSANTNCDTCWQPSNGTLTNNGDGTFTYTPERDYNGTDSFVYEICDTDGLCDTATVTIDVAPVNDPPVTNNDSATTLEDTPVDINATINDTDVDGNLDPTTTTATVTNGPSNGTVANNGDGSFIYTPNKDYNGPDSFEYQVCDTNGACDTATVTITVTPVNDPAVANDDSASADEDTPVTLLVLENDFDVDGNLDTGGVSIIQQPEHGTVAVNLDGAVTYTPDPNFNGPDTFEYQVCDTDDLCDTATVTIDVTPVNDPPVAEENTYTTLEDTELTVSAPGVLANDSDVDGDILTANLVTGPSHGTVTQNPDGSFTYTPNENFNGEDRYTYEACDPSGVFDTATITIIVGADNDPPVANDDAYSTDEDMELTVSGPAVLGNDSDVDGDTLTANLVTGPSHGTVTQNPDGSFTYTPNENFNGEDSYTYQACDPIGECDTAIVTITVNPVNDPPVAVDDAYSILQDTTLTVGAPGVLINDSDIDEDAIFVATTYASISQFGGSSVAINSDGSFSYTPAFGFAGIDTFTSTISDGNGGSDTATVTITVEAKNNRSISVDLQDFYLDGTSLSGMLVITNQSDGYNVQITDLAIEVQYQVPGGSWTYVAINEESSKFNPAPLFLVEDQQTVHFYGCELESTIPSDATVRVTAKAKIFGRIKGKGKADGWFISRLSK